MSDIHVTMTQDDIEQIRETGHIVREGVYFCSDTNPDVDREQYERICALSESTLYRNGEAHWTDAFADTDWPDVHVTYDRPSFERMLRSELEWAEQQSEESERIENMEWYDGQLYQLTNIFEWLQSEGLK